MRRATILMALALLLAACIPVAPKVPVVFWITGPEGTVVEVTRNQNGNKSTREAKLERESPRDKFAKYAETIRISDAWDKGVVMSAKVVLTEGGSERKSDLEKVALGCVAFKESDNAQKAVGAGNGSVSCKVSAPVK